MHVDNVENRLEAAPLREIPLRDCATMEEIIEAFEDGLIDLVVNDPTGISGMGFGSGNEVRNYVSPSMYYLGFNMEHAFVMTAQYRYAISYLVDRATIVHKYMLDKGVAAVCPIVPASPLYDASIADVIRYSPKTALPMRRVRSARSCGSAKATRKATGPPPDCCSAKQTVSPADTVRRYHFPASAALRVTSSAVEPG